MRRVLPIAAALSVLLVSACEEFQLGSLWARNDSSTAILVRTFYLDRSSGEPDIKYVWRVGHGEWNLETISVPVDILVEVLEPESCAVLASMEIRDQTGVLIDPYGAVDFTSDRAVNAGVMPRIDDVQECGGAPPA